MRLSEICEALDLPKGRVDQWAHRGLLVFDKETKPGSARDCTKADAARIAMLGYLSKSGISVEKVAAEISRSMRSLLLFSGEKSFLVISASRTGELIDPTPRGQVGMKAGEGTKIITDMYIEWDAVRESALARSLSNPDLDFSLVFNLTEISNRIEEFWVEI